MTTRARPLALAACLTLAGPACAKPLGSCGISLREPVPAPCAAVSCLCLSVENACPFPVTAVYDVGGDQRTVRIGAGSVSREACATPSAPGTVRFLAWRPAAGYPRGGDPVPMDGASLTGPVPVPR